MIGPWNCPLTARLTARTVSSRSARASRKPASAWYRRTFDLPETDAGKRLWLEFDGVYRDCDVFVNGWFVGHHNSGYDSFRYDITDVANYGGKNIVAVKVDASQFEGWFYEGAGIYRHVWLVKTSPVAIAPGWGFCLFQVQQQHSGRAGHDSIEGKSGKPAKECQRGRSQLEHHLRPMAKPSKWAGRMKPPRFLLDQKSSSSGTLV